MPLSHDGPHSILQQLCKFHAGQLIYTKLAPPQFRATNLHQIGAPPIYTKLAIPNQTEAELEYGTGAFWAVASRDATSPARALSPTIRHSLAPHPIRTVALFTQGNRIEERAPLCSCPPRSSRPRPLRPPFLLPRYVRRPLQPPRQPPRPPAPQDPAPPPTSPWLQHRSPPRPRLPLRRSTPAARSSACPPGGRPSPGTLPRRRPPTRTERRSPVACLHLMRSLSNSPPPATQPRRHLPPHHASHSCFSCPSPLRLPSSPKPVLPPTSTKQEAGWFYSSELH